MQTKDIVGVIGVTNNLLRYYEEKGVIQPKRMSNGYRNYQRNDVCTLLEGMRYARLGFEVGLIPDFVSGTQVEQVSQLKERLEQRQQELVFHQLENQALEKRIHELEQLPDTMNSFCVEQIPDRILLPYRSWSMDSSFDCDIPDLFSAWAGYITLLDAVLYIPYDSFIQGKYEDGKWCLAVDRDVADQVNVPVLQEGIHKKSMYVYSTYVETDNGKPMELLDHIRKCTDHMKEDRIQAKDDILVRLFMQNRTTSTVQIIISCAI